MNHLSQNITTKQAETLSAWSMLNGECLDQRYPLVFIALSAETAKPETKD